MDALNYLREKMKAMDEEQRRDFLNYFLGYTTASMNLEKAEEINKGFEEVFLEIYA